VTSRREHFRKRLSALETERSNWDPHWTDLYDNISPRSPRFTSKNDKQSQGNKRINKLFNSTGTIALRTLVSGLMSGVTSPARPWFQLRNLDRPLNESRAATWWLEMARNTTLEVFLKSNLYTTLPSAYRDLGICGTSAMVREPDPQSVVRFRHLPVGSYYIASDAEGRVNTCYRKVQMTASQIITKFGEQNCSTTVKDAWKRGNTEQLFEVCHAVEPNAEWDEQKALSKYKRFISVYFEVGGDVSSEPEFLSIGGFDEFPVIATRWDVTGEDDYGTSPGMEALSDIKTLQVMERRKLQALDKIVNPPMVGPTSLRNRRSSVLPGDTTYVDDASVNGGFRPAYQITFPFNELLESINATEKRISDAFYKDLFLMISQIDTGVTATEIAARQEEKLMMLGPVYLRLNDEMLDHTVEGTFQYILKAGMLPPPPPDLQGAPLGVEYISIMAQTMKSVGVASIDRLMTFTGSLVPLAPEVLDKINLDKTVDHYAEMVGVPSDLLQDDQKVAQIRGQRMQAAQMQQAAAMAPAMAGAMKDASQADLSGDNPLSRLIQNLQGAPTPPVPGVQ
jgi:hypothetical protein